MELFVPFGFGAALAAVVCWWPLGRVANPRMRRLLRCLAIALGVTPTIVTSPGLFIGFVLPAALELVDGVAHGNLREILKSGGLVAATAAILWTLWSFAAWVASRRSDSRRPLDP